MPRKNVRLLARRNPLIAWTVEQALETKSMHVMVSTDDPEIAEIARGCGADVPLLRPAELAQDETPTEPVVEHAINWMRSQGRMPRAVMLLQAEPRPCGSPARSLVQSRSSTSRATTPWWASCHKLPSFGRWIQQAANPLRRTTWRIGAGVKT
ncbi:MAG: hypothetical protein V9E81_11080 [Marmoricola sp.]